jgi:formylglycine-generating enzyme required for sulfatase activity
MKLLHKCIALVLSISSIAAEIPSLINYQGLLTDINGNVVSGNKSINIAIYDAATNGTQLYFENVGVVSVQSGIYSFQFGTVNNFANALATGNQHWLQVTIDNAVQSPRERLVSVPFALKASTVTDRAITLAKLDPALKAMLRLADPGFVRIIRYAEADSTGYGSVNYPYQIGKYEITLNQYVALLNAVAATDTYALFHPSMTTDLRIAGISRSGTSGSYAYSIIGSGNRPVTFVSWFDAARYCNWLHNGQPSGAQDSSTTEDGAYALNGAISGVAVSKKESALYWIPSEDEWYLAAYYSDFATDGVPGYWLYPTHSNETPGNLVGSDLNQANYKTTVYSVTQSGTLDSTTNYLTEAGAFSESKSFLGTYDQAGNVWEWNDAVVSGTMRGLRGGSWSNTSVSVLAKSTRNSIAPTTEQNNIGFRIAGP